MPAAQAVLVDGDHLAGLDLADEGGTDDVEGRGLGGDHPAALEAAEHERPDALRVAGGVERVLVHPDEGEGALDGREQLGGVLLEALVGVPGQQRGDQLGVVGGGRGVLGGQVEAAGAELGDAVGSSRVLVRLPLCARAIEPVSVGRNVGWALCQVLAPVVE